MPGRAPRLAAVFVAAVIGAAAPVALPAPVAVAAPAVDQVRAGQWYLEPLDARGAWRLAKGAGVTVAVIDSGVDADHPDLAGQVLPGRDLVDRGGDGHRDPVGHGTTVASLIAGKDDDLGVVGIAPKAKILPVRVLDAANRYNDAATVAEAVRWAVDQGASVLNLSLGGSGASPALAGALRYAFAHDVVVVACTGNIAEPPATPEVWYPAREPGVVAVAGLQRREPGTVWPNSITGPETVLTAPATDLVGARPGGYWRVQGTSFAAPLVAGTAALIRSRYPEASAATVVARLIGTARDLGPAGRDRIYGFGAVNPVAALTADIPVTAHNPLDASAPSGTGHLAPSTSRSAEPGGQAAPGTPMPFGGAEPPAAGGGTNPAAGPPSRWPGLVAAMVLVALLGLGLVGVSALRRAHRTG